MDTVGLAFATRFSYPPNSLSLCGPSRQSDLSWYSEHQKTDAGTADILSRFSTLYPYLCLIAGENNIRDPFDPRVIEAYWVGNPLLHKVRFRQYIQALDETIGLSKHGEKENTIGVFDKISDGALPHHSFHVLSIHKRTGHNKIPHTLQTMDACLIQWGKVIHISSTHIKIKTRPLQQPGSKLKFGNSIERSILWQGTHDILHQTLAIGDWISYHWGYVCTKLTTSQLRRLIYYTHHSLAYANKG